MRIDDPKEMERINEAHHWSSSMELINSKTVANKKRTPALVIH